MQATTHTHSRSQYILVFDKLIHIVELKPVG